MRQLRRRGRAEPFFPELGALSGGRRNRPRRRRLRPYLGRTPLRSAGRRMKYSAFLEKTEFSKAELLASAWGTLVEDPPRAGVPSLPAPPLLMFDRIVEVSHAGSQGRIIAEQDIALDAWFFQCHFRNDPVQPGCLGVDAIWQLLGFYAAVRGAQGAGRALGGKEI